MMRDEEHHVDDIPEAQTMTAMDALRNAMFEAFGGFFMDGRDVAVVELNRRDVAIVEESLRRQGFAVLPAIPLPR